NGHFNCIWQGDANEMILRSLALTNCPPTAWNLCRPEVFSVRAIATRLGALLDRVPRFMGQEMPTALLGNPAAICSKLGDPAVPLESILPWVAAWVRSRKPELGKPTHFDSRDGQY